MHYGLIPTKRSQSKQRKAQYRSEDESWEGAVKQECASARLVPSRRWRGLRRAHNGSDDEVAFESLAIDPVGIVSAKVDLKRIRMARYRLLEALLTSPDNTKAAHIHGLSRYERLAFARQRQAFRSDV
jgi:hypothetical protein